MADLDERIKALEGDHKELKMKLYGADRWKDDRGDIGELKDKIDQLPKKILGHWKSVLAAVVLITTLILNVYKLLTG